MTGVSVARGAAPRAPSVCGHQLGPAKPWPRRGPDCGRSASPEPADAPLSRRHYVVRGPEMTPYEGESAPRWRSGRALCVAVGWLGRPLKFLQVPGVRSCSGSLPRWPSVGPGVGPSLTRQSKVDAEMAGPSRSRGGCGRCRGGGGVGQVRALLSLSCGWALRPGEAMGLGLSQPATSAPLAAPTLVWWCPRLLWCH